ncbi:MAG: head GIN domain-containing protein [Flavobacteriaceae bacterium]
MNTCKSILAFALLVTTTSQTYAQWGWNKVEGNGDITTKTITTETYDEIKAIGSIDVHLMSGTEGNISVTTDANLQEYVEIEVSGNTLKIKLQKNISVKTRHGIHVTVPFTEVSAISLTGSGDVDTKDAIKGDFLEVSVTGSGDITLMVDTNSIESTTTGSGDITLNGKTNNLKVNVTGSGDFRGFELEANNTKATVSGSGDAKVVAKQSLTARVNGSGDITYKGNPERSDTKTSGSGDISSF